MLVMKWLALEGKSLSWFSAHRQVKRLDHSLTANTIQTSDNIYSFNQTPEMKNTFEFNPSQLWWLQEKQKLVGSEMERIEKETASNHNDWTNWNLAYGFQAKLYADAQSMKIPQSAVPNVTATWNAIRNRAGKGMCRRQAAPSH
ncbi:hypothetical protein PtB15_12B31 [Puccinia triticina]|nr:hypothetical protein PtB15_12B31 [Puccinia triticina]